MASKHDFVSMTEQRLERLNAQIKRKHNAVQEAPERLRQDFFERRWKFEEQKRAVRDKLMELKATESEHREDLRNGLKWALTELRSTWDGIQARF